jgi:hypothetical protein
VECYCRNPFSTTFVSVMWNNTPLLTSNWLWRCHTVIFVLRRPTTTWPPPLGGQTSDNTSLKFAERLQKSILYIIKHRSEQSLCKIEPYSVNEKCQSENRSGGSRHLCHLLWVVKEVTITSSSWEYYCANPFLIQ